MERSLSCKYKYRNCLCLNMEVLQHQEIDKKKKKEIERTLGGKEQSKKYKNYRRVGPGSNMKKMLSEKRKLII